MPRLLLLTATELTRDPRARRAAEAGLALGFEVVGVSGQLTGEEVVPLDGVQVHRTGRPGRASAGWESGGARSSPAVVREARGLFRLARLAARTVALWRTGRTAGQVHVVHANDLATLPAGALLARSGARLVYDAHELYAEFERDPPRAYRALASWLERRLARRAAAVVTVSDPLADELERRLALPQRPLVVLNAPRREEAPFPVRHDGPLRVVYQGAFGSGRRLDDLLAGIAAAPNVELTVRVVRTPPEAIRERADALGLAGRVRVADPLPPDRLLAGLAGCDVGVVFDRPVTRNAELTAPNKLFEYLMAGLAVVGPRLPGLTALVEREGVGVLYEAGSARALGDALERLAADRDALLAFRRRALDLAQSRLNAEAQRDRLAVAWKGDTAARA